MFGRTNITIRWITTTLVVVFVACGGESIIGPPPVQLAAVLEIPPFLEVKGTSVELTATVRNAEGVVTVEWIENGSVLCRGNPCFVSLSVGIHSLTVNMNAANGSGSKNFQATITPADIIIEGIFPASGAELVYGELWDCEVSFHYEPGPTLVSNAVWKLDGRVSVCGETLSLGTHTLEVTVTSMDGTHEATESVTFTVVSPPYLISYTVDLGSSWEFFTMERDSGEAEQLTNSGGWKRNSTVSPDGTKIAYTKASPDKGSRTHLYVANRDGTNARQLTRGSDVFASVQRPYWFPNGRKIVFSAGEPKGNSDVANWTINADGTNLQLVPTHTCPRFIFKSCVSGSNNGALPHPEGLIVSYLAWDDNGVGRHVVVLVEETSGREIRVLHRNSEFITEPYEISSDGDVVLVASPFEQKGYVVRTNGSSLNNEPFNFRASPDLTFCGDSKWAYYRVPGEPSSLWRIDVNGGGAVKHTTNSRGNDLASMRCVPQN